MRRYFFRYGGATLHYFRRAHAAAATCRFSPMLLPFTLDDYASMLTPLAAEIAALMPDAATMFIYAFHAGFASYARDICCHAPAALR